MIKIELAKTTDLDGVMKVIKACSADLISKKIFQWSEKYPNSEVFKNDIDKNTLFVTKHKSKIIGCVRIKGIINSINQENMLSLMTFFFRCKVNIHFIAMKKLY